MDEFADLEADLSAAGSQVDMEFVKSLVMSVEYDGLEHGMFISDYRQLWHPLHKISLVFFGILLIPVFGLGVFMIIAGTNKGPMMKETEIVEAKVYLVEQHAVVAYSMIDEDIGSLAYYAIEQRSFIKRKRETWETDNGGGESVEHLLCSGSEEIQLLKSYSHKNINSDGKVMRELSRLANLPIR
tara:strand:+ start:1235 stop:1789 length:555 start_codon:yes stop_codon:yes gene_type:complete